MSQHMRFGTHLRAPKTQPYHISLREFSFPCPFICWYCFFYLLCLTYFTEGWGRVKFVDFKRSLENYIGWFIFPGSGGPFAYSYAKKWRLRLMLWQILYCLNKYDISNNMSWLLWRFFSNVFSFIWINSQFSCRKNLYESTSSYYHMKK